MNEKGHFSFGFLMRRLTNWELTSSYAWEKSHPCSQVLTGNIQDVLTDDSAKRRLCVARRVGGPEEVTRSRTGVRAAVWSSQAGPQQADILLTDGTD